MNSPQREFSLNRSRHDPETHNMTIVDDLLSGLTDWRSVPDIVRLTFKAILDILKSQNGTLKQLELDLPTKASKSDLSQFLILKSAQNDMFRSLSEVKQSLESKVSTDELYSAVNDKVSKNEMAYQLSSKASYEEVRGIFCEKADFRDLQVEVRSFREEVLQNNEEGFEKMRGFNVDLQEIVGALNGKPSREEMIEALEEKANKQSVANALHRKANKVEVENGLADKVDVAQFNQLSFTLDQTTQDLTDQLKSLTQGLEKLVPKLEYEQTLNSLHTLRKEFENKSFSHFSSLEGFVSNIKSDLEDFQIRSCKDLETFESRHSLDLQKVFSSLNNKVDITDFKDFSNKNKQELIETNTAVRIELVKFQDLTAEKTSKLEQCCKGIQDELFRLHGDIKGTNENLRVFSEKNRENIEDSLRSYQNFVANMLEESKRVMVLVESVRKELMDLDAKKMDKLEAKKLTDCKVELREFHEGLEKIFKDCSKIVCNRVDEVRELLNRKEKELVLLIDAKPGVHEVNSLILDQSLGKLRKGFRDEQYEGVMRSSEFKESYSHQYVDLYNSKNH